LADLVVLAHRDGWDFRYQVSALAAASAAGGSSVAVCLFFGALSAWAEGRWDAPDLEPPLDAVHLAALDFPPLGELLAPGRAEQRIRVYACSASVRFLGLDAAAVQERVDAVLGWQSFARLIAEAQRTVSF
jgi:peroxiredoxin family protein